MAVSLASGWSGIGEPGLGIAAEGVMWIVAVDERERGDFGCWWEGVVVVGDLWRGRSKVDVLREGGAMKREGAGRRWGGVLVVGDGICLSWSY